MGLSEKIANAESSDWIRKGMTDEEVIKNISEAKEEARERIKLIDTLDKIKAEIEQLRLHKAQFLTSDNKICIDSQEVLNIIDKYKVESEDKENDSN